MIVSYVSKHCNNISGISYIFWDIIHFSMEAEFWRPGRILISISQVVEWLKDIQFCILSVNF